ncbi:MAG: SGNH/GDSL hydrolase family protein [Terrimonas sp.]|nr:SGNH/GDSL hydrolase family protein [Terrimonas sp.]
MRSIFLQLKIVLFIMAITIVAPGFTYQHAKLLIIGDSISIGYTPYEKKTLADKADVIHCKGNAKYTANGLQHLDEWLGDEKWDIIQFNWGLWDLCYRNPDLDEVPANRDKINGTITTSLEQYQANLEAIVKRLKQTKAKLVFVTTTYVPENEPGRYDRDVESYNDIAKKVMQANGVGVIDIYPLSKEIHQQDGLGNNNVHYTDEGYRKLSDEICKEVKNLLN